MPRLIPLALALAPGLARAQGNDAAPAERPRPRVGLIAGPYVRAATAARATGHWAIGGAAELALARGRFAAGLDVAMYEPFQPRPPATVERGPLVEISALAGALFKWSFIRSDRVDAYLVAGQAVLWSRPVSLVDPVHRRFSPLAKIATPFGIGARARVAPSVLVGLELRDTLYVENFESRAIDVDDPGARTTWYGSREIAQLFEAQLGVSVELP